MSEEILRTLEFIQLSFESCANINSGEVEWCATASHSINGVRCSFRIIKTPNEEVKFLCSAENRCANEDRKLTFNIFHHFGVDRELNMPGPKALFNHNFQFTTPASFELPQSSHCTFEIQGKQNNVVANGSSNNSVDKFQLRLALECVNAAAITESKREIHFRKHEVFCCN